jgi:hypothetical protein
MALDNEVLKQYGIVLKDTKILTMVYSKYEALVSLPISDSKMLGIDLTLLPNKPIPFKEVLLKWLLMANEPRLLVNEEPLFPMALIKQCPIWKVIRMPVVTIELKAQVEENKSKTINKIPNKKTIGNNKTVGAINRK